MQKKNKKSIHCKCKRTVHRGEMEKRVCSIFLYHIIPPSLPPKFRYTYWQHEERYILRSIGDGFFKTTTRTPKSNWRHIFKWRYLANGCTYSHCPDIIVKPWRFYEWHRPPGGTSATRLLVSVTKIGCPPNRCFALFPVRIQILSAPTSCWGRLERRRRLFSALISEVRSRRRHQWRHIHVKAINHGCQRRGRFKPSKTNVRIK